jgi:hypothetical protein
MLLPVRTATNWFHNFVMRASEVRFMKGHLKFKNYNKGSPFGCMIIIFDGTRKKRAYTRLASCDCSGRKVVPAADKKTIFPPTIIRD